MPSGTRSAHSAAIIDGVLAIADRSASRPLARTLTNDIENVLTDLAATYRGNLPSVIIYRDSEGIWDGISHRNGDFIGFYPLRESDRERAIAKAKARRGADSRYTNFEYD